MISASLLVLLGQKVIRARKVTVENREYRASKVSVGYRARRDLPDPPGLKVTREARDRRDLPDPRVTQAVRDLKDRRESVD